MRFFIVQVSSLSLSNSTVNPAIQIIRYIIISFLFFFPRDMFFAINIWLSFWKAAWEFLLRNQFSLSANSWGSALNWRQQYVAYTISCNIWCHPCSLLMRIPFILTYLYCPLSMISFSFLSESNVIIIGHVKIITTDISFS